MENKFAIPAGETLTPFSMLIDCSGSCILLKLRVRVEKRGAHEWNGLDFSALLPCQLWPISDVDGFSLANQTTGKLCISCSIVLEFSHRAKPNTSTFLVTLIGVGVRERERSTKAFAALHAAMLSKKVYALARFTRASGAIPR